MPTLCIAYWKSRGLVLALTSEERAMYAYDLLVNDVFLWSGQKYRVTEPPPVLIVQEYLGDGQWSPHFNFNTSAEVIIIIEEDSK